VELGIAPGVASRFQVIINCARLFVAPSNADTPSFPVSSTITKGLCVTNKHLGVVSSDSNDSLGPAAGKSSEIGTLFFLSKAHLVLFAPLLTLLLFLCLLLVLRLLHLHCSLTVSRQGTDEELLDDTWEPLVALDRKPVGARLCGRDNGRRC
jgi:hypothetical protein